MSPPALPTECIELILRELQEQDDVQTLGHLLLVNRHFCSVTLPYFYYTAIEGRNIIDRFALFQLLLRQRPPKDISPLLSAAFDVFPEGDQPWTPTSTTVHIDYLKYVRSFYFEDAIFEGWPKREYTSRLFAMAFTSKTGRIAYDYGEGGLDASLPFPHSIITEEWDMERVRRCALATVLRRDLTWTLCTPFLEQVRTMNIPLSDIGRYMPLLERFKSLVCLDFQIDEFLEYSGDLTKLNLDESIELEQCWDRRNQQFKDMLLFVQKHTELFPGQLQEIDCPDDIKWGGETMKCPDETWDELTWLVQSKKELKEINTDNWELVSRRIHKVNLGSVKVIDLQWLLEEELGYASYLLFSHPPILSRCRNLRELYLGALSDSFSFKWAADEKLASNRRNALDRTLNRAVGGAMVALPKEPQFALIPLEVITVTIPSSPQTQLEDLVFAFGDTLKEIKVRIYVADGNIEDIPALRVGQGWNLPQIHTVSISSDDVRLLIDPDLLRGMGESLERIELQEKCHRHQCRDLGLISPPSNPLPRLHTVSLHGRPAILFHPDTLLKILNLENLVLGTETGELHSCLEEESLGELGGAQQDILTPGSHLSRWTWNWNLPSLRFLSLDGEFAYHFSFRMLESCSSLRRLHLHLRERPRTLELQDFISTSSGTRPTDGGSLPQSREMISSSVEELTLRGGWEMRDELLLTLYSTVFPNMLWLTELGTTGYSLQGWLAALKGHGRLIGAQCGLPRPDDDDMIIHGMGLVSKPRPDRRFFNGVEVINDEDERPLFFFEGKKAWYYDKESS